MVPIQDKQFGGQIFVWDSNTSLFFSFFRLTTSESDVGC